MQNTTLILFGATGDLARLKILPGLLNLWAEGQVKTGDIKLILVGRRDYDTAQYFNYLKTVTTHPFHQDLSMFEPQYVRADFEQEDGFQNLWETISQTKDSYSDLLFYMSLSPDVLELTLDRLADTSSQKTLRNHNTAVITEKPFGDSLSTAYQLQDRLCSLFGKEDIFRNDHYLHKPVVESLLPLRERDQYLREICKPGVIDTVELVVSEDVDLGTRVTYFDCVGMSVDWFQSHMLQLLASMFADTDTDDFRLHKKEFIESLQVVEGSSMRAQYEGYDQHEGIKPECETETFFAAELKSTLATWQGVKFKIVAGKALRKKEVFFNFKLKDEYKKLGNEFRLNIDPNPTITDDLSDYAKVILKALQHNHHDFISFPEIEAEWQLTEALLSELSSSDLRKYTKGMTWQEVLGNYEAEGPNIGDFL